MATDKLSNRSQTSDKTGGLVHIIKPSIIEGEYDSYKISVNDLLSGDLQPVFLDNKTGNVNFSIDANTFFESCLLSIVSGVPIIRIGITAAGEELLQDFTCTDNNSFIDLSYLVEIEGYIYLSIQNGTLNLRFDIKTNYKNL